ncbi:MAG: thioesterase family protein [Cytophagales bacterium]
MYSHITEIRVRYAETDKMGYVYHGNYATYFEVARVEAMKALGISYKELEEKGIMMPVLELKTKYIRPAKYDDLLKINLMVKNMPSMRILFEYETFNEAEELLNKAETTLVFVSAEHMKPILPPQELMEALRPFIKE